MAIAFDASSSGVATGFNAGPRTITYSHVVTGADVVLVAWVGIFQDVALTGTVSAISYNGVAMTQAIVPTNQVAMEGEMWYLINPATGSHTFSVTVTGATDGIRVATASFTGVDQSSPLGVTATSVGSSGNPAISITTATANSVSVSGLVRFGNTAITASTFTNMVRANANNVTLTFDYNLNTTAGSYTNTQTGTVSQDWIMGVIELKPTTFPIPTTPTSTTFATSVTSMPVTMPASIASGDLLTAFVEVRNAGTYSTVPTGWTSFLSQAGGGATGKLDGFYKIAAGTESGTTPTWIASTGTTATWQVVRTTNWHGTTPPEATTASGDATAANPPSLTPSWGALNTLWLAVAGHAAISAAAFTAAPANYNNFLNTGASTGGSAVSLATSYRDLNATSEDPGAFTAGGSNRFWAAATVAIRPIGSAPPPTASSGFTLLMMGV